MSPDPRIVWEPDLETVQQHRRAAAREADVLTRTYYHGETHLQEAPNSYKEFSLAIDFK